MLSKYPRHLLLILLLCWLPLAAGAQQKAQLNYSVVNGYLELFTSLKQLDQIVPSMMILSTNPKVTPQSIEMKIQASDGWQVFRPDENGVIEFSSQPGWADSNLISNQPKGSLQLVIGFSAIPLGNTTVSYQQLMGLVPQFEEALTALAKKQGQPPPTIKGLTIQFPEGSGASVSIQSPKSRQPLKSSSAGMVIMKYKEALWQENPQVVFSETPLGIVPLQ